MDKALEEKLDQINNNVLEIKQDLESVKNKLDGFIDFSNERSTKIEDAIETTKKEIVYEIQKMKLDTGDKYATNERVDKQELRIQKLETKAA